MRPAEPGVYRSRAYAPLRSWQVRRRRFRSVGPFRRGLDPADVREFLDRVADDLAELYDELNQSREETSRIKDALRRWQSEYAPRVNERAYR
ncbi:DivIVA domain-containing protein [Micromonospora sagamiensis]|nr:DivIVA domain-containing protein [Micromonospora sagamiensis]